MREAFCWEGEPVVDGMAQTKKGCVLYLFFKFKAFSLFLKLKNS